MNNRQEIERALSSRRAYQLGQLHQAENMTPKDIEAFMSARRDFYIYEAQALALAASGNATDTIQIEADSNFILQKLSYFAVVNGLNPDLTVATTILFTGGLTAEQRILPLVTVQLTDTGSGRQLMQEGIPIPSMFGHEGLPYVLNNPRLFLRNTTIQVNFVNADTVNAYDIRLAFHGYKVYTTE